MQLDPQKQLRFAADVVHVLRAAGYEAYWAGGCVRDQILGRTPKDYDVATSATPAQIQAAFKRRKTLSIGAAFGVIGVLGPPGAGQIEVATFRQDLGYTDGRHPDRVAFSTPREDALRRDFTINGMFYDPLAGQVLDYVGGEADLTAGCIRAIGDPAARFGEDKLRMLRAVRFAAVLDFQIEPSTLAAIQAHAPEILQVSAERIAAEMRLLLHCPGRSRGLQLLRDSNLLPAILPEWSAALTSPDSLPLAASDAPPAAGTAEQSWREMLSPLAQLEAPSFSLALAALLVPLHSPAHAAQVGARWKLSTKETTGAFWLLEKFNSLWRADQLPWSQLQPLLASPSAHDLVALHQAYLHRSPVSAAPLDFCRERLAWPRDQLDPPPFITGSDLIATGLQPGKQLGQILTQIRAAQLDGQITSKPTALTLALRLATGSPDSL